MYGIGSSTANKDANAPPAVPGKDKKGTPAIGERDTGVHKLELFSGPTRTVHYYANRGSPSEEATLRKLEQAENEMNIVSDLQALRQQYVNTEFMMEARRREVQRKLYGLSFTNSSGRVESYPVTGWGMPSAYGTPFAVGNNAGFGGTGFFGGFGGYSGAFGGGQITLSQNSTVNESLANGIGDEGRFKTAMVTEMARMSTPESTAAALRNYETALANVVGARARRDIAEAGHTIEKMTPRRVIVTTTAGNPVTGLLVHQDNDWITIRTEDSEERIRMADVSRIKTELKKK